MFVIRRVDHEVSEQMRTETLALVEESDGTGEFLVVQRSLADSAEDARVGWTGSAIVRPGGETAYHALENYTIGDTELVVWFTPAAAEALSLPRIVHLPLDLPPDQRELLAAGLRTMVGLTHD